MPSTMVKYVDADAKALRATRGRSRQACGWSGQGPSLQSVDLRILEGVGGCFGYFLFFPLGGGEGRARGARKGGGWFLLKLPREGGSFRSGGGRGVSGG